MEEKRTITKKTSTILLYNDQEEWFQKNIIYNKSQIIREGIDIIIKNIGETK